MTNIEFSKNGNSPFEQLIGHNLGILKNWVNLEVSIFKDATLDQSLLEQIRRTLAFGNECEYCMVKGGRPNLKKENKREQLATGFAELYSLDHKSITPEHFEILKEVFNEIEISELCSFISFISSCQKLGRIYNLTEEFQTNKVTEMANLKCSLKN